MSLNRRETVEVFQARLTELIERSGLTRSAFAAEVGLDRSTLTQLLADGTDRLPRAETIVAIAAMAQVSVDWMLGLSQAGRPGTELVASALEIEPGAGLPMDERLRRWHEEAAGYKIRYVPATLPDLFKTEAVIRYEYQVRGVDAPETQIERSEARLAYSRRPETDLEVCSPFQELESFARGEGIWRELAAGDRIAQLERMVELVEELYPTFRWFLFDGRRAYSVPYSVYGPGRAAVYFGDMYFVFYATEQIRVLVRHFDNLIRKAVIQPTEAREFLARLSAGARAPAG